MVTLDLQQQQQQQQQQEASGSISSCSCSSSTPLDSKPSSCILFEETVSTASPAIVAQDPSAVPASRPWVSQLLSSDGISCCSFCLPFLGCSVFGSSMSLLSDELSGDRGTWCKVLAAQPGRWNCVYSRIRLQTLHCMKDLLRRRRVGCRVAFSAKTAAGCVVSAGWAYRVG
jgi:hypothetical protein